MLFLLRPFFLIPALLPREIKVVLVHRSSFKCFVGGIDAVTIHLIIRRASRGQRLQKCLPTKWLDNASADVPPHS